MAQLTQGLSGVYQRPVVDMTGLEVDRLRPLVHARQSRGPGVAFGNLQRPDRGSSGVVDRDAGAAGAQDQDRAGTRRRARDRERRASHRELAAPTQRQAHAASFSLKYRRQEQRLLALRRVPGPALLRVPGLALRRVPGPALHHDRPTTTTRLPPASRQREGNHCPAGCPPTASRMNCRPGACRSSAQPVESAGKGTHAMFSPVLLSYTWSSGRHRPSRREASWSPGVQPATRCRSVGHSSDRAWRTRP